VRKYERERAKLERQAIKNAQRRAKAIRDAASAGLTLREIAELVGLSYQRVGQIVKRD
jgi:DNA-directed RNA polymerase specialized sigma subunit